MASAPRSQVQQKVLFVPRPGGGELYAVVDVPGEASPEQVVVFCSSVFEEQNWAYPVVRNCARRLRDRGIAAVRFDYYATGESCGASEQFTMREATDDIATMSDVARLHFPGAQVVFVGVRVGCRLLLDAVTAASQEPESAPPLILWDPVIDFHAYLMAELRKTLAGSMVVFQRAAATRDDIIKETLELGHSERDGLRLNQVDGYPVTATLLSEAAAEGGSPPTYPFRGVAILTDPTPGAARKLQALNASLPHAATLIAAESPYWIQQPIYDQTREQLFRHTEECVAQCRPSTK
jgi:hypothetical protein